MIFERTVEVQASAAELFAYHARPHALPRLTPPFEHVRNVKEAPLEDGAIASLEVGVGPLVWPRFVARHERVEPGRGFHDVMIDGPFRSWRHEHIFEDGALTDRLTIEPPPGAPHAMVEKRLARIFTHRHATTQLDLALFKRFPSATLVVGVTGARGLIGAELCALLSVAGHRAVALPRDATTPIPGVDHLDAVVHLGGEPIAGGRLDDEHLARVRASRVEGTRAWIDAARALGARTFVSASAVGYYGDRGDVVLDEDAACGTDVPGAGARLLAEVCRGWEREALTHAEGEMRRCALRIGIAISPAGGALGKMLPAFLAGAGAKLGDGKQWMAVVSVDDVAAMFYRAVVDESMRGAYNAVGPEPLTNADFTALTGRVLHRPTLLSIPKVAARAMFGRAADEAYLASQRAVPARLSSAAHPFRHATAEAALRHVLGRV